MDKELLKEALQESYNKSLNYKELLSQIDQTLSDLTLEIRNLRNMRALGYLSESGEAFLNAMEVREETIMANLRAILDLPVNDLLAKG